MLTQQAVERLREVLRSGPRLRLAVAFGSRVRETAHTGSDLDIGVIPSDPELTLAVELEVQRRLEAAFGAPVDLVRLDRASTLVRWAVAGDAQLVLADPLSEFSRFQASAALEHADLMTTLGPAAERFRQRLARGSQSSAARGASR